MVGSTDDRRCAMGGADLERLREREPARLELAELDGRRIEGVYATNSPPDRSARSACFTTATAPVGRAPHDRARTRRSPRSSCGARHDTANHVLAQEATHVRCGTRRELRAARSPSRPACTDHGHRQGARADAGLQHAHAGTDVGQQEQRTKVLRIDDLRTTRHLQHKSDSRGRNATKRSHDSTGRSSPRAYRRWRRAGSHRCANGTHRLRSA